MLGDERTIAPALDDGDLDEDFDLEIELDGLEPLPKALVGAYLIG